MDGYNVAHANQDKKYEAKCYGRKHRPSVYIWEECIDNSHIIIPDEEYSDKGHYEHANIQEYGQKLVGTRHLLWAVAYKLQDFKL